MTEEPKSLQVSTTEIPGLLVIDLPVHGDSRGWFKENWQREKMVAAGLTDFIPVQNNISFNEDRGTTRGIHAEPWDKYVSVATGRIFGAWVDLRPGETFGQTFTTEIDPSRAVFVPRGVGNAYQTLEPATAYTYLVNDHWSPDAEYAFLNLADETAAIDWPIPLDQVEISPKDQAHPRLADVTPIAPRKILVIGSYGQLGHALADEYADVDWVEYVDQDDLDITSDLSDARPWRQYSTIINAAALTAVDAAETPSGRALAWAINSAAVASLAQVAAQNDITLVHVSSDYVFDGTKDGAYTEEDRFCPLGVYGQTKAAGDLAAAEAPRHYIVRTSWVIGDGKNFVKTMYSLAQRGITPAVVDDQRGRLTFTPDLARGIRHLLDTGAEYGTYNLSSDGEVVAWNDVAAAVYQLSGHNPADVSGVSTADYYATAEGPISPRPENSELSLEKIEAVGFEPADQFERLQDYVAELVQAEQAD